MKAETAKEQITLQILVGSQSGLAALMNTALPASISFRLKKLIKTVQENLQDMEATRIEICNKYGTLNEKTNSYEFEAEAKEKFEKEFGDLLASEVDLNFEPIKSFDLRDATISAAALMQLEWLITE